MTRMTRMEWPQRTQRAQRKLSLHFSFVFGASRRYEFTMSICATLWKLKFPKEGDEHLGCDWIEITAQAVPPHIGSPTPGGGYEGGDPYATFLPPALQTNADGEAPHDRAVVFVTEYSTKGTPRSGQEYASPSSR